MANYTMNNENTDITRVSVGGYNFMCLACNFGVSFEIGDNIAWDLQGENGVYEDILIGVRQFNPITTGDFEVPFSGDYTLKWVYNAQSNLYTLNIMLGDIEVASAPPIYGTPTPINYAYALEMLMVLNTYDRKIYPFSGIWGGTFGVTTGRILTSYTIDYPNKITGTIELVNTGSGGSGFTISQVLYDFSNGVEPETPSTDPYAPGGNSETGGGTGSFDGTGDDIDIPGLPTLSAVDTGFITLFNPSAGELRNLANYMWGDLFDIATWKKIFADPMDAILGLSIVPVAVPNGGETAVTVGNISTGVSMNKAAAQYVEVDCGTLNVNEYWGAYLDYDPYTKAEIYLPYIGTHPLAVDDIMNKSVHVVYHIDILSGACCAYVKCGGSVLYSFVGQCSCSIPITGNDWTNVVNGALSIAASIGTMVATGGATAPMAATAIASTAVNSMKPNVEKSGSMGGMGGMLGVQTPYLILTRPRQALPSRQNAFMGYPSFITLSLGDCSGYTEIEKIHLVNVPATEQELSEIENLLKGGVIL